VKSIAGLLLAAGASSRMGRPKQLLPLGRWSLLEHAIRQALGSDIDVLFLVLGSHAKEIRERLAPALLGSRLRVIENPRFGEGISTSIISGIRQIEPVYEHTLILLGDMPWITSDLINHLIEEYLRSGLSLGAVRTGNGRTLPVIVGRKFYPYLYDLHGDVGARELFLRSRMDLTKTPTLTPPKNTRPRGGYGKGCHLKRRTHPGRPKTGNPRRANTAFLNISRIFSSYPGTPSKVVDV